MSEPKCNGVKVQAQSYSLIARMIFSTLIMAVRNAYVNESQGAAYAHEFKELFGDRFKDDGLVLWTLQSAAKEAEFLKDPRKWIVAALRDCAQRDYWYTFEKSWT